VAVERFLQLALERNYSAMGWVFGTSSGPINARDPRVEVEQRMYGLANLLESDGFVVGAARPVPGRMEEAVSLSVALRRGSQRFQVPFTVVRGPQGRWFVEQIGVESITVQ
jgi:hypothetical protein